MRDDLHTNDFGWVLLFLAVICLALAQACAPPELGPEPTTDPVVTTECEMTVVNRHVQDGALCKGDFVATGMVSLSPARIQCASIDWKCE